MRQLRAAALALAAFLSTQATVQAQSAAELNCKSSTIQPSNSPVWRAASRFELDTVEQVFLDCLIASRASPGDMKLAFSTWLATDIMSAMTFGFAYPDDEKDRLLAAQKAIEGANPLQTRVYALYLGAAYQFGLGVAPDKAEARRWYARSAQAGDPVAAKALNQASLL